MPQTLCAKFYSIHRIVKIHFIVYSSDNFDVPTKEFLKRIGTELRVGYTAVKSEYVHLTIFVIFYMQADFIYPDGIPQQDEKASTSGI